MSRGRALRLTAAAIGIALGVAGWFLLAPRALGGRLSYVVVARGTSMEPVFHTGDLALVRPAETYSPGQVVAYRSHDLGSTVLHRIVERVPDGYVLKGDNNDFLDPEHPQDEDILGALWIRVPLVGSVMGWLRHPFNAAVVAGAAVFLTVAFAEGRRRGANRRAPRHAASRERSPGASSFPNGLGFAAGASGVFLLLAVIAFSRPTSTIQTEEVRYQHTGSFSYGAEIPPGPAYPDGVVRTGDPLFLRLVDAMDVTFSYTLDGGAAGMKGTGRLFAEIGYTNGWKRSVDLQAETSFTGTAFEARGRLDMEALRRLVRSVERTTGVTPDSYTVRLGADVRVDGSLSGVAMTDTFPPRVNFRLDALQMQVERGQDGGDPFQPAREGSVKSRVEVPNRIALGGVGISVGAVRLVTMLGSIISLLLLAFFGLTALRGLRGGEASRIQARYGAVLVRVRSINGSMPAADVDSFEDLLRVADRSDRVIFHEEWDGTHSYVVEDGKLLLRYRIHDEEREVAAPPEQASEEAPPEPEVASTVTTTAAPSSVPEEVPVSEVEVQPIDAPEETEEPVVPATPPISWSDGWAVGPTRKR